MAATIAEPQINAVQVVRKLTTLATLPEITAKIIQTVEDQRSTAAQLHQIIAHDPALVTRILKVVNSAFYGLPGQIGSVERAIVLLGLNAVKNIAVAASIGQLFKHGKLCEGIPARELWTHCIGVGVAARDIAKQMKSPLADEAFLAGMIHDVGIIVALQSFPDQLRQVCEQAKLGESTFCDLERQIIGLDHQQLGAALAEQWKFPRSCQLVAGYHHRPHALVEQGRMLVNLVHVADTLCCKSDRGFTLTAYKQSLAPEELATLQIDPAHVQSTSKRLGELMSVASSVMG